MYPSSRCWRAGNKRGGGMHCNKEKERVTTWQDDCRDRRRSADSKHCSKTKGRMRNFPIVLAGKVNRTYGTVFLQVLKQLILAKKKVSQAANQDISSACVAVGRINGLRHVWVRAHGAFEQSVGRQRSDKELSLKRGIIQYKCSLPVSLGPFIDYLLIVHRQF